MIEKPKRGQGIIEKDLRKQLARDKERGERRAAQLADRAAEKARRREKLASFSIGEEVMNFDRKVSIVNKDEVRLDVIVQYGTGKPYRCHPDALKKIDDTE
ncbi:hypothetical protein HYW60_00855 [Candidatus Kaiserbacteria bacterium]|nr:hypothetical protein [Candidatus Kaiserbacteria bacterium]